MALRFDDERPNSKGTNAMLDSPPAGLVNQPAGQRHTAFREIAGEAVVHCTRQHCSNQSAVGAPDHQTQAPTPDPPREQAHQLQEQRWPGRSAHPRPLRHRTRMNPEPVSGFPLSAIMSPEAAALIDLEKPRFGMSTGCCLGCATPVSSVPAAAGQPCERVSRSAGGHVRPLLSALRSCRCDLRGALDGRGVGETRGWSGRRGSGG